MTVTMWAEDQATVIAEIVESLLLYSHELTDDLGEITRTIEMPDTDWLPITVHFADDKYKLQAELVQVNRDKWECRYAISFEGGR